MTASTFDLLPDTGAVLASPTDVSGETGVALTGIGCSAPRLSRSCVNCPFPMRTTPPTSSRSRPTGAPAISIRAMAALLAWSDLTGWEHVSETIYMLHTGQGASSARAVAGPDCAGCAGDGWDRSGAYGWRARRRRPRLAGNIAAGKAGTIILVGSEGGSTWGFAATLAHGADRCRAECSHRRHVSLRSRPLCRAPNASSFWPRPMAMAMRRPPRRGSSIGWSADRAPAIPLAVLGFGDRSFPRFCAFARAVSDAAADEGLDGAGAVRHGGPPVAAGLRALGPVSLARPWGLTLELCHQPAAPASHAR